MVIRLVDHDEWYEWWLNNIEQLCYRDIGWYRHTHTHQYLWFPSGVPKDINQNWDEPSQMGLIKYAWVEQVNMAGESGFFKEGESIESRS